MCVCESSVRRGGEELQANIVGGALPGTPGRFVVPRKCFNEGGFTCEGMLRPSQSYQTKPKSDMFRRLPYAYPRPGKQNPKASSKTREAEPKGLIQDQGTRTQKSLVLLSKNNIGNEQTNQIQW